MRSYRLPTGAEAAEYRRLDAWRTRWQLLSRKFEPGRLQSRQERIERRAQTCNHQIRLLMRSFDIRTGNTNNPV